MIKGAKYQIRRPQDTLLGWEKIHILERREISTKTIQSENETKTFSQYEYVFIGESEGDFDLVLMTEDEVFEDLLMNYSFVGIDNRKLNND